MAQVNVYGTLRLVTGQKRIPLDLPAGATLGDYLVAIAHQYPALRSTLLDDHGMLLKDMPVFLNSRNPRLQPGYWTRVLQPQDVLSLFSPFASGRMNVEVLRRPAPSPEGRKMKVNFYATLRPLVGGKTVEFAVREGVTAQELLENIVTRFPAVRAELLNEEGRLHGHVHFFINGRDVQFLEKDMQTVIRPQDTVNVFPAVGGGCK